LEEFTMATTVFILLNLLLFVVVYSLNELDLSVSFTTSSKLENQIDSSVEFLCLNQLENGEFLPEIQVETNELLLIDDNSIDHQSQALYSIAMYYTLNHDKLKDVKQKALIIECIIKSSQYLQTQSISIPFDDGQLLEGNTGSTGLAINAIIEICINNKDVVMNRICHNYADQFLLWTQGLISMRNYKLQSNNGFMIKGAFPESLQKLDISNSEQDSKAYLAFTRLIRFKKYLYSLIDEKDNKMWTEISSTLNGLDKYYFKYPNEDDAKWLIQAWFQRWVTLNINSSPTINPFLDEYIIKLMKPKVEEQFLSTMHNHHCNFIESILDFIHALSIKTKSSKYDIINEKKNLQLIDTIKGLMTDMERAYIRAMGLQIFYDKVDFYFDKRFDGGFINHKTMKLKADYTSHCLCAFMKIKQLFFNLGQKKSTSTYGYIITDNAFITDGNINAGAAETNVAGIDTNTPVTPAQALHGYEYFVIGLCVLIGGIIVMNVALIYICWYSPYFSTKRQIVAAASATTASNDLYFLGQTMTSDENAKTDYMHIDDSRPLPGIWTNNEEEDIIGSSSDTSEEDDGETDTDESDPLIKNAEIKYSKEKLNINKNLKHMNVKKFMNMNGNMNANANVHANSNPLLVNAPEA